MRDRVIAWTWVSLIAIVVASSVWAEWYKASVQAEVYRRQGVEMTTLEVMLGAKPIERTVTIKEHP